MHQKFGNPANSLSQFIRKIKSWIQNGCPCVLRNTYIGQVGYINETCTHKLSFSAVINTSIIRLFSLRCVSCLYRVLSVAYIKQLQFTLWLFNLGNWWCLSGRDFIWEFSGVFLNAANSPLICDLYKKPSLIY